MPCERGVQNTRASGSDEPLQALQPIYYRHQMGPLYHKTDK